MKSRKMKIAFAKGFAFTILFLFLGVSILPNICGNYETTDDFDSEIVELMKKAHMPSLVACIIKDNMTAWSKGYGYSDYYNKINTSENFAYPVASLTKSVTATAIMQIVENDSYDVSLDDNVSKYLPFDLKNPKYPDIAITFRMLLAHQSSLGDTTLRFTLLFTILKIPYNLNTFEKYLSNQKVWNDYKPGEGVCYSTEGIDILGLLVEQITKQSYSDYCQENIFIPLKMYNTSFYFSDFNKEQLACLYSWIAGFYFKRPFTQTSYVAGMGLKTTVSDFSHFLIMHTSGGTYDGVRILSKEAVDEMHSVQYPGYFDDGFLHGLGWYQKTVGNDTFGGHGGLFAGARAVMTMRYSDNTAVLYFWNQNTFIIKYFKNARLGEKEAIKNIEKALFEKANEL